MSPIAFGTSLFCALSFVGYGASCLWTTYMVREFTRYGLAQFRVLTGILQLLGATGLVLGLWWPLIGLLASTGLALQMLCGFAVRLKIRDGALRSAPALFYALLNSWLCMEFWKLCQQAG